MRASSPDGRLETLRVLPSPALAPFVHHIGWVRWRLRAPFAAEALSHPSVQIVLTGTRRAEVHGVYTTRISGRLEGRGETFRIAFRPAMFQPLLRAPVASIADRVVRVADVLGPTADAWARAIHAEPDVARKLAIADAFLAPLLLPIHPEVVRFRDLVERMANERTLVRVEDVAAIADLDVRSLQRAFRTYVGVSPKWILRRYRLHEAAEQLKGKRPPALAALAASLGYADQAHFARDFKRVIGHTPRAFAQVWSHRAQRLP